MITDIRKPNVSKISKGTSGKNILIYGEGGTGKTSNAIKAPDVLVLCFENGLAGLEGVNYFVLNTWADFQQVNKLLMLAAADVTKPLPCKTVVIDGVDRMGILASRYVAALHGATVFSEVTGDARYSIWDEFKGEIDIQINAMMNSPYATIWIDHFTTRPQSTSTGELFDQICPAGDARVANKIFDTCDICAYAQRQPNTEDGKEVLSTLFIRSDCKVATKTRFTEIVSFIPEWNYEKLAAAIDTAVGASTDKSLSDAEAQDQRRQTISEAMSQTVPGAQNASATQTALETQDGPISAQRPLADIVGDIGSMLKNMQAKGDNSLTAYHKFCADILKEPTFSCKKATEQNRAEVEAIYDFLKKSGFTPSKI